jgi:neopullulanase
MRRKPAYQIVALIALLPALALSSAAQSRAPRVIKVDPPNWWPGHSINPVRVLIHGANLNGARVTGSAGLMIDHVSVNDSGTYAFADVHIPLSTRPGTRTITITTSGGSTSFPFEIQAPLSREGRFQGFSPDDVIYLIMIDRFADGDPANNDPPQSRGLYDRKNKYYYHGGDLQGVIDRLPYLKELGVTALWLTPWYDNYDRLNEIELKEGKPCTGFHGYNPQDFYAVDEHFGTLPKLRELVEAAHKFGLKIIQDEVVNHTGPYHPWVEESPTRAWFNGTRQNHLANVFQTWVLHDQRPVDNLKRATMEGWFLDFLPDLNQHDPETERYLIQNTLWWIGVTGLDGIRMDTWQYVPNSFWAKWSSAIKRQYPHFTVVGEVKDGDAVHTAFFQGGVVRDGADSRLDSLLDFPLFYSIRHAFAEGKSLDAVPKTLARDYLYTNSDLLVTLLGGHDDGRFMSEAGAGIEGLKLATTFLMTTRGVPQLYYGDEIAMTGPDESTTRADFPGGFPGDRRDAFTRAGRSQAEQGLVEYTQKMTRLHRELEPLRRGKLLNLYVSEQQYAYVRKSGRGVVIVALNNDKSASKMEIEVGPTGLAHGRLLSDRLGNGLETRVTDGKVKVNLPPRSAAVLVPR